MSLAAYRDDLESVHPTELVVADAPAVTPLGGNPALVGAPLVVAGAIGLGLVNIGFIPAASAGACLPSLLAATAVGLFIATVWAAALGQNVTASIFGVFFGFYASYGALVLGLTHGWFGIAAASAVRAEEVWFVCWIVAIVMLTLATLRMPSVFTLMFVLVDVALVLLLASVATGSVALDRAGAIFVFGFIADVVYLYFDAMSQATGGKALPLGDPLLHS